MINLDDIEIIDDDEPLEDSRKRGPHIGKIQIIQETENWAAINKPPYVPSLPERGKFTAVSVQEWAKSQWPDAILCHRIDRETSGVLLIAKNPEAYRHFSMQFEHRKVTKIYHAVVNGQLHFQDLWIDLPIIAEQVGKIKIDRKNGKPAQTRFKSLQVFRHFTLMECEPKTGRSSISERLHCRRYPLRKRYPHAFLGKTKIAWHRFSIDSALRLARQKSEFARPRRYGAFF